MLTPPDAGLPPAQLDAAVERSWGITVTSIGYRPVGWGSHHWEASDANGSRWFVTADELANKTLSENEPLTAAYGRLRASLAAARALQDAGHEFVVAPVPAKDGEPLTRVNDAYGLAVYPFVEGQSFQWAEFASPEHRLAVLGLLVEVHTAGVRWPALTDDFAIPHRDELEAACTGARVRDCGPYAQPVSELLARHAAPLRRLLAQYDARVPEAQASPVRAVLTHGEPLPGNTMLTAEGWRLIDWDTALIAPPERDLWSLDPGDGSIFQAYADATGVRPLPALMGLYRLRWDVADIAVDVSRFRRPHDGSPEDDKSWELLSSLVESVISGPPQRETPAETRDGIGPSE